MKLMIILTFAAALQVSAKTYGQQVSLNEKNSPLSSVFKKIEQQTGFSFVYTGSQLANAKSVSIKVSNIELEKVLALCFSEQPFTYSIIDKNIIVKPKTSALQLGDMSPVAVNPPAVEIKGRITDEQGNPLAGASVKVKGSSLGVTTDGDGRFVLSNIKNNEIIEVSFVGFVSQAVSINNNNNIAIILKRNDSPLEEIQVGAYNKSSKRLQTGNVTTVKADDISKQPVQNPLQALEGRVPGLFIKQSSGMPGAGINVRIQGQNSIANGNIPFYVIDGVPYINDIPASNKWGDVLGSEGRGNPLSYIDISNIESIDILKDADATAIYGSRAANGAILITTKKGKQGKMTVNADLQQGFGKATRSLDVLNTKQYLEMRHEALKNQNISTPAANEYDINGLWDTTRYTNWQKVLAGNTASYSNAHVDVSGGSGTTQYFLGTTYHRETTVMPGDFNDKKISANFNLSTASLNRKFKLQLSAAYQNDINNLPTADPMNAALTLPPDAPAVYNADGTFNWALDGTRTSTWSNPVAKLLGTTYQRKVSNLLSNLILSYQLADGLSIQSNFGFNRLQTDEVSKYPISSSPTESIPLNPRATNFSNSDVKSFIIEPQINYTRHLGPGKVDILAGGTINQINTEGMAMSTSGYASDNLLGNIASATSVTFNFLENTTYKYSAGFARINYNIGDKYLLNLTARRDGSSNFGAKDQFHNFGAIGGAWIFSSEGFLKKYLSVLSFGKLRASYGTTGSDQIGSYRNLDLYNISTNYGSLYQGATSLTASYLPNPYIQWEETKKTSVGLDLGFFKDRILIGASYSSNQSSNQLLFYALPVITGVQGISTNFPATVRNETYEFTLGSKNIVTPNFSWETRFNLTFPKNKLVAFPNLDQSSYANDLIIGQPIDVRKVFESAGVNPQTGLYQFLDRNGNLTSSPQYPLDAHVLKTTSPVIYGGLENKLQFHRVTLNFLFQFCKQTVRSADGYALGGTWLPGRRNLNQSVSVLDRWQQAGDMTPIQRYGIGTGTTYNAIQNLKTSDAVYADASYIRLKNISLSYPLPSRWLKNSFLQRSELFLTGQNLLTITKFPGIDPETVFLRVPPLKVITFGARISL